MQRYFEVENLFLYYKTLKGIVKAVDGVSFHLNKGEAMALIGESGCGKSSLSRAILRLLPRNVHRYEGVVRLNGDNIMEYNDEKFRKEVRWVKISYVPQAAMNALNPVIKIGDQIAEPLILHKGVSKNEALEKAAKLLNIVNIPSDFINRYPFELSGGMRQRVAIAMALVADPEIVIMDEPTSALDVLTQANILNEIKDIRKKVNLTIIYITHDISVSSEIADKVAVMYAGEIVEFNDAEHFFKKPQHPYSKLLLYSVPTLRTDREPIYIKGSPPSLINPPTGCRFKDRCPYRFDKCEKSPPKVDMDGGFAKCWLLEKR
ncbi:MAG: dipeptide/oligopeptide/nickel ABC transporter ATP-binding protein [Thermofilum sp. ex4484_82]|nr:MAG: dipeptide/oligopeptide/nickel ABC transporter ATP-binding protein [Thermofilum sp. ex4484_82]OYT39681.1 MAG: dipeptide/oligopeptide/nickel ABC transporter ATP-binding protein [Archaeoglobales archaeon ex4484_92]RLF99719.1 MAG: ABC transporter ATP-binding protein [Candidatus Wolframiiraptor sp.]